MANDYGPNNVYANIPPVDSRGENQIAKFMRWNPDPIGTSQARLGQVHPDLQAIVNKAQADNPNLHFIVGSGLRSANDQQNAYNWGWSTVKPNAAHPDVNQRGIAADLWPLDNNGRPTFDQGAMTQVGQAMKTAAAQLGTPITWGGDWNTFKDRSHFQLNNPSPGYTPGKPLAPGPQPNVSASTAPAPLPGQGAAGPGAWQGGGSTASNVTPAAQPTGPSSALVPGGSTFETLRNNIAQFESKGDYHILGPTLKNGDYAIGKYQVLASNVPNWTQKWLGQSMTADQFRANPQAQDKVFEGEFGSYLKSNSPADAASMWFTGKPLAQGANEKDVLGTSGAKYAAIATKGLDNPNAAPTATASTAPAPVGTTLTSVGGGDASKLPGFGTAAASKSFTEGLEKVFPGLAGGAGGQGAGEPNIQPSPIIPPPPARNVAPPMAPAMEAQLTGYMPKPYGQTLNSFAAPLEWGSAPPGASPYAASSAGGPNPLSVQPPPNQQGAGTQMAATQPIGTSLNSLDPMAMQQRMALLYGTGASGAYGGY